MHTHKITCCENWFVWHYWCIHLILSSFEDPGPHGSGRYSEHMLPEVEKNDFRKGAQVYFPHLMQMICRIFEAVKTSRWCCHHVQILLVFCAMVNWTGIESTFELQTFMALNFELSGQVLVLIISRSLRLSILVWFVVKLFSFHCMIALFLIFGSSLFFFSPVHLFFLVGWRKGIGWSRFCSPLF